MQTTVSHICNSPFLFSNINRILESKGVSEYTDCFCPFSVNDSNIKYQDIIYLNQIYDLKRMLEEQLNQYGFILENPDEIISFINENVDVMPVLQQTKTEVNKYFEDATLVLSLYTDNEENYKVLNIEILNNLPPQVAFEKEGELFDNWFEKHCKNLNGKITLREYPLSETFENRILKLRIYESEFAPLMQYE